VQPSLKVAIHTKKVAYKTWIQRKFESSLHALYAEEQQVRRTHCEEVQNAILGKFRTKNAFQLLANQQSVLSSRKASQRQNILYFCIHQRYIILSYLANQRTFLADAKGISKTFSS